MNSADGTIHFNLSFSQNSVYLRVRSRERFVNPQLLKQLAVYKIKRTFKFVGIRRVFSTKNEEQYITIGEFWDEMSKVYGREEFDDKGNCKIRYCR